MESRILNKHLACSEDVTNIAQANTPIHRLPPELLATVFLLQKTFYWPNGTRIPWLTVSQVCRRWMDVAYETATLWSSISISRHLPPHIVEKSLQLSKSAPLDIKLHMFEDEQQMNPPLEDAVCRIRCFRAVISVHNWEILRTLFTSPAPLLESLSLHLTQPYHNNYYRRLDDLFSGITQQLRYLSVSGCAVDFGSSFLANLTILEISNPKPQLGALDLLAALHKLPRLKSLRVSNVFQSDMEDNPIHMPIPRSTKVVKLSSLGLLSIYGLSYAQDLDFLSYLSFPSTTILLFSSGYPHEYHDPLVAISDFWKIHASARQNFGNFAPTRIDLSPLYGRLKLDIWDNQKLLCAFKLDNYADDEEEARYVISDDPEIKELFSRLSFLSVTEFSTNCYVSPFAWPIISSSFPNLQCLSVEEVTEEATVIQAIIDDYKSKSSLLPNLKPIFPRLRSLSIAKAQFDDDCKKCLIQALKCQKARSSSLNYLKLDECFGVDEKLVVSLREVEGLDVDWCAWSAEGRGAMNLINDEHKKAQDHGEIDLRRVKGFDSISACYYMDTW
ncbi:hypothetical protein BDN72DRAFT_842437 [Pluteus cervinus]|uniref:Uncharacterized protein n=1 Tax=Pluteus cervinus TaxID=181527 RepID=A0ACD3APR7_9AGAR|nr:hypothetical protein BDN72DRAFT_842437 [Pluteus cervinus]